MSRSASIQFRFLTRREAAENLAQMSHNADNVGDYISVYRRTLPVTTEAERQLAQAFNRRATAERARKIASGEWPAHGPIIVRPARGAP